MPRKFPASLHDAEDYFTLSRCGYCNRFRENRKRHSCAGLKKVQLEYDAADEARSREIETLATYTRQMLAH